ncbi:LacI family DNA-binding transcriptional regulator [Nitratireductor sp. ZSWI3]|uniref:LacI family DNA-binding transcriptional regulator n=1 Tax=Nitratireductor sp. ZSWI3 TaxID=2966359 RepID=UPI0021503607|nr:LacI family DNA-binding transcriptional regulator [Nitratireductor sp. ZSWI3]MCR4266343.1 LacI family DNA-binding transcriptional regulator [Nitratireductor sp. ZSWI3]
MDADNTDKTGPKAARKSHSRSVTMKAVGRLAGVSQVTVSRALSDPSKVSPETLAKIREAIKVTGFVPNALAGALASNRSKLISALVPSITNIVYAAMVKSFSDEMRGHGYEILLSETGFAPQEEQKLIAAHLSRRPDAVLLTGINHSAEARKMLLGADIPVIELWDITDSPIDLCVGFSHVETARAVADFAHEAGYRRAGTITAGDERALRRKSAFTERFAKLTGSKVLAYDVKGPASIEGGRRGLADLIDHQGFESGVVFCSSDLMAHGAVVEAHVRGIRIPQEIAIIGFGDQDFARHIQPALTTVRIDREALGRKAAEALLARLEATGTPENVIDLGFEIIRRDSA